VVDLKQVLKLSKLRHGVNQAAAFVLTSFRLGNSISIAMEVAWPPPSHAPSSRCQMRRQHDHPNSRNCRSESHPTAALSISFGSSHVVHSSFVMGLFVPKISHLIRRPVHTGTTVSIRRASCHRVTDAQPLELFHVVVGKSNEGVLLVRHEAKDQFALAIKGPIFRKPTHAVV
jgi:hypothetical protein